MMLYEYALWRILGYSLTLVVVTLAVGRQFSTSWWCNSLCICLALMATICVCYWRWDAWVANHWRSVARNRSPHW